jgi:hypothetical protein
MYSRYWSSALPHIYTHELLLAKFLRSLSSRLHIRSVFIYVVIEQYIGVVDGESDESVGDQTCSCLAIYL